jgi:dihydroneopterin aldolase
MMLTEIHLQQLDFFSYHGKYPMEKKEGNRFVVDVKMCLQIPENPDNEDLSVTVDYAAVYALVKAEMDQPCALLESLVQRILGRISKTFPQIVRTDVTVAKANPAFGGLCKHVSVHSFIEKP